MLKLGHAIRNVISHAINASPNGGHIEVLVYFEVSKPEKLLETTTNNTLSCGGLEYFNVSSMSCCHNSKSTTSALNMQTEQLKYTNYELSQVGQNDTASSKNKDSVIASQKSLLHPRFENVTKNSSNVYEINNSVDMENELTGMLVIEIKDSGAGMSLEKQSNVFFNSFDPKILQTDEVNQEGDLALFIAKSIIDLHNGTISVKSDGAGLGTTFRIELPMTRNKQSSFQNTVDMAALSNDGLSTSNYDMRKVLVDLNFTNRNNTSKYS